MKKLKDLLFPSYIKCIFCGDEIFVDNEFSICSSCMLKLPHLIDHYCKVCGRKVIGEGNICDYCKTNKYDFKLARAPFVYTEMMHKVVHNLKYNNAKYLAEFLSKILYNYYKNSEEFKSVDLITCVPIYKKRLKKRGYNQSELLLQSFIQTNKVRTNIVDKVLDTGSQTNKNYQERISGLDNAFVVLDKTAIKNKTILIVDDILTTGATINTISKELLKNGAKAVMGLTLCGTAYEYRT